MNNSIPIRILKAQCMLAVIFILLSCTAEAKFHSPLVWDMESLDQMKLNYRTNKEAQKIIRNADRLCEESPVTVTENKYLSLGPNKHYLSSMGPYRWKDSHNPGKYIIKDGEFNPDWYYYDSGKLNEMVTRCICFSKAYYITRNRKYYNAFINQIHAWFIDKETYMEPNFEYSQAIPNQEVFKSNSTGMIDAYVFIGLTESIYLVNSTKRIDRKTMKAMKSWMSRFAEWSDDHYSAYFAKVDNNISLAFDVTLVGLYLFAGETNKAKAIVDNFNEKRILRQIQADGSQPGELKRTRAFSYSLYNLSHILDLCLLARYWYPNYYQEHRERIDKAYGFIGQYVEDSTNFPYQQITSWEVCKKDYYNQLELLKKLQ